MKITKVNIPASNGLEDIKMNKLSDLVLIAGKNGSGKSRILRKIVETINTKPKLSDFESEGANIQQAEETIKNFNTSISTWKKQLISNPTNRLALEKNIKDYAIHIKNTENNLKIYKGYKTWDLIETNELNNHYAIILFVPKTINLSDSTTMSPKNMIENANSITRVGIEKLSTGTFAKIQHIQNIWFETTHPNSTFSEQEKAKAKDDYKKLKSLIKTFFSTDIGRSQNSFATIFGFPLAEANLSDGQKVLLQLCLAIYSQEASLKDLILIMDEPENHLHPSAIIEIIDKVLECIPNGQLWIATHSVPLLAHFDPSKIWYVENGKIEHAGKIPEKVLTSLLGDENEIQKLQDFISLPAQLATNIYAFQSLFEPHAVTTNSTDPQSIQIRSNLLKISSNGKLRILDYGAGKGRLISNIVDLDKADQDKLIESIDYIAFDKYVGDKDICESALINAYGGCIDRYFNDIDSLTTKYDKGTFDVIIMCNVLHEIDPKHWLNLFKLEGEISSLLKENGVLLLVEDQHIPTGEKAYVNGFLVLDTPHLKDLFQITEQDLDFKYDSLKNGRLKAHFIPKSCLIRINNDSITKSIKSVCETAKRQILTLRQETTYKSGNLHGFWTQQFANAQLILDERTKE